MSAEQIAAVFAGRASVSLADITSEQAEFLDSQRCDFCAHWAHRARRARLFVRLLGVRGA